MPDSPANLLVVPIAEPNLQYLDPEITQLSDTADDALARYKAIVSTYVTQLVGLKNTHVRFLISPSDEAAAEAVSFWILPILQELGEITKLEGYFHFSPAKNAPPITLEFTAKRNGNLGFSDYEKSAGSSVLCLECGARWLNMAFLKCSPDTAVTSSYQLSIFHKKSHNNTNTSPLPELPLISDSASWDAALETTLGAKLKKFYEAMI